MKKQIASLSLLTALVLALAGAVSVSQRAAAQCAVGAVGTYTVWAWAQRGGDSCGPAGSVPANLCYDAAGTWGCQVVGTAQLTCP